jgi:hypothetical protein
VLRTAVDGSVGRVEMWTGRVVFGGRCVDSVSWYGSSEQARDGVAYAAVQMLMREQGE